MPPRARKTAATKPESEEQNVSDEVVVETTEDEKPKRKGRTADPLTAVIRAHRKAKGRLDKAQKAADKVAAAAAELEEAQAEFASTKEALTTALAD